MDRPVAQANEPSAEENESFARSKEVFERAERGFVRRAEAFAWAVAAFFSDRRAAMPAATILSDRCSTDARSVAGRTGVLIPEA